MSTRNRFMLLFTPLIIVLLLGVSSLAAAPQAEHINQSAAPDKILIGNPISLSGPNTQGAMLSQVPSYDLWAADVNAAGGIYVAEYDKRILVEIVRIDDTSDLPTAVQLTEQLILEDQVHFLFPPWGTTFNFTIAPLVSELQMPVLGCTINSKQLQDQADNFPYFFTMMNPVWTQGEGLVDLANDLNLETAAIIHHTDMHGIEFANEVLPQLTTAGVDIVLYKTFPTNPSDLSQLLEEVQVEDPDVLIAFSYPGETFMLTTQMAEMGYKPNLFYASVGVAFPAYRDVFGAEAIEGTIGAGVWNPNVPVEGARDFFDRYVAMYGTEPDRWASAGCYASGQVLQQAIEQAGTLDHEAVRDAIATGEFETILGTVYFEDQFNVTYPGYIGQWQNGEFEVVEPADRRTVNIIYPQNGG